MASVEQIAGLLLNSDLDDKKLFCRGSPFKMSETPTFSSSLRAPTLLPCIVRIWELCIRYPITEQFLSFTSIFCGHQYTRYPKILNHHFLLINVSGNNKMMGKVIESWETYRVAPCMMSVLQGRCYQKPVSYTHLLPCLNILISF